jgi:pimeloyl-ACP methyl ester carboxylesterase
MLLKELAMSLPTEPEITSHRVTGAGGLELNVLETGEPSGPCVLFIHGFSQSAWAWECQLRSPLGATHRLLALDIRGHGESGKPLEPEHYTESERWADDIAAVMTQCNARDVLLVGWSYGGFIICDYLRKHGQSNVSGLVFVGAATKMGTEEAAAMLGSNLTKHVPAFFGEQTTQTVDALAEFVRDCFAVPPDIETFYKILGYNAVVPPAVRKGLFSRRLDNDDVLSSISVPTAVVHGQADQIVLPSSGEHIGARVSHAKMHWLDRVGHCPFAEAPQAFNDVIRSMSTTDPTAH